MLVLTRLPNERVVIEDGRIVITVISVDRGRVILGFDADRSIEIHREEVQIEIDRERREELFP